MRRALALAAVLSVALAAPGVAAPRTPQITDPTGDAPAGAGYDIVSALFSTEGNTAKVGRKTVYTPTKLVVTVTYAGTVAADPYAAQVVEFDIPGCEGVYLERFSGGTWGASGCVETFDFGAKTSGKTVTFTLPFAIIGKNVLKKGAVLTGLRTYTAAADPVLGYETAELTAGQVTLDSATTTKTYKIA